MYQLCPWDIKILKMRGVPPFLNFETPDTNKQEVTMLMANDAYFFMLILPCGDDWNTNSLVPILPHQHL